MFIIQKTGGLKLTSDYTMWIGGFAVVIAIVALVALFKYMVMIKAGINELKPPSNVAL